MTQPTSKTLSTAAAPQPTDPDRRRVIEAFSRHEETPRRLVIELTADGTDYLSHGDFSEEALSWATLRAVLASAGRPLTRREIRRCWPRGSKKPDEATVWRWLQRQVGHGTVVQLGQGRRDRKSTRLNS